MQLGRVFFVASFGGESGFEIEGGHSSKTWAICLNMYCHLDFLLMVVRITR